MARAARALMSLLAAAAAWAAPGVRAQEVVTSAAPDHVSVTLYRAPDRAPENAIDPDRLKGFALITETRTVTLPAGTALIRFEGVAGNILPESALVAGLPEGVEEKNLDASLLSPRTLFDRALGRRVMIRRTDRATGKVLLQQATIRSSADGAAVLQIGGEFGDLQCSGLPETLIYDGVPPGLSAKPTLSVRTTSPVARTVTLTLSYLAGGFDWQADYIVAMRPDGRHADLFAWITLASSDVTSFPDADTQVVAGRLNRTEGGGAPESGESDLWLKCWPMPSYDLNPRPVFAPAPAPAMEAYDSDSMDIIVTGSLMRRSSASSPIPIALLANAESLGDLKLYRFPRRVTVASNGQKQVAMLSKPGIKLRPVYVSDISQDSANTKLVMRGKNVEADGLGIALPGGKAAFFARADGRTLLVGESSIDDKTVGEDLEFDLGEPGGVDADIDDLWEKGRTKRYKLRVENSNPWPVEFEARISVPDGYRLLAPSGKLGKKDGKPLWTVAIPANGKKTLIWSLREPKDEDDNE